jgi:hypothetical protein
VQPVSPPPADPAKTLAWHFGHITGDMGRYLAEIAPALKTTPGQLRGMMLAVSLLALITFLVIRGAVSRHHAADKTVAIDAAPSIVAAQKAKAALAAMHAHAVRGLLGNPDAAKEYEGQRAAATAALLKGAETITYGDAERKPMLKLLNGLLHYHERIVTARILADRNDRDGMIQQIRDADVILHTDLFPAAKALDDVNSEALDTKYKPQADWARWWEAGVVAVGITLVGMLVYVQVYFRRRFRRALSPQVVLAIALATGCVLFTASRLIASREDLRLAKEDAFASLHVLQKAKADGYVVLAAGQLRLLDPERAEAYKQRLSEAADRVAKLPDGLTFKQLATDAGKLNLKLAKDKGRLPTGFGGYLREELDNITFDGEQPAAVAALTSFGEFADATAVVRGDSPILLTGGLHSANLATKFARVNADLDTVIGINELNFNREIGRGEKLLDQCGTLNLWAMLGVVVLTAVGLYPRLREYAI